MTLIKIQKKGQVTLPSMVREKLALYEGSMVDVKIKASQIIITPQTVIDRSDFPNADDEYTPAQRKIIDAELREAMKSPTRGPFNNADEMILDIKNELKKREANKKMKV